MFCGFFLPQRRRGTQRLRRENHSEKRDELTGSLMTVFLNRMTAPRFGSPADRCNSFSNLMPSIVSYESKVTVMVCSPSLCTMVLGSEVCESSVTRQSTPPSGFNTITSSLSIVIVPGCRSGKKAKSIAFEFENLFELASVNSTLVILC